MSIDAADFVDGAGEYTLSLDVLSADADANLHLSVYNTSNANYSAEMYRYKWKVGYYGPHEVTDAELLNTVSMPASANAGTTQLLDFTYDGTGDVVISIGAASLAANLRWSNTEIVIDNVGVFPPLATPLTPYEIWADSFGLSGTDAELGADPDIDLADNLVEYAYNGEPDNALIQGTFPVIGATSSDGSTIEHIHTERVGDPSISYTLQQSPDLLLGESGWVDNTDATENSGPTVGDYKSVTNTVPTAGDTPKFLRVKLEK